MIHGRSARTAQRESSSGGSGRPQEFEAESDWIHLTYVGPKALSLTGSVTGARYHFGWRGATLPVDRRDAAELLLRADLRIYKQPNRPTHSPD